MRVLGIETATRVCAVALASDGQIVREELLDEETVHARKLLTLLDSVVTSSGHALSQVDAVAVSIGPGSFTGLRIGLSTAKGIVYATGATLIGVPTLEALARKIPGPPANVLCVLDARRDDFYCQLFGAERGRLTPRWPAKDLTAAEILRKTEGLTVLVTGEGREKLRAFLAKEGVLECGYAFAEEQLGRASAAAVALLGEELIRQGHADDPMRLEPHYVKEFFLQQRSS